jgi:Amt family ammonium transporter
MMLNGILAGLVGVTAGADVVSPLSAIAIGAIAGGLVVGSVLMMDKVKVDDPVGAVSVHLVCGVWGTVAVGLFSTNPDHSLGTQLLGVAAYAGFTVVCATILFLGVKATMGLRVNADEETEGLDSGEHAMHAYDFLSSLGRGAAPPLPSSVAPMTDETQAEPTPAQ